MSLNKLGVGVIGTGMAAAPHAKALNDLRDNIDLRGVFSLDAKKCKICIFIDFLSFFWIFCDSHRFSSKT